MALREQGGGFVATEVDDHLVVLAKGRSAKGIAEALLRTIDQQQEEQQGDGPQDTNLNGKEIIEP